jgi:hypothetical protein
VKDIITTLPQSMVDYSPSQITHRSLENSSFKGGNGMRLNKSFVTAILMAQFFTNIFAQAASSTSPAETKIESPDDLFLGRNFSPIHFPQQKYKNLKPWRSHC